MAEMTPSEVAATLRQFNGWRRDFDDKFEQPDPREIGEAIDAAVEMIERMKVYETALREIAWSNDTNWQVDRARAALEESK